MTFEGYQTVSALCLLFAMVFMVIGFTKLFAGKQAQASLHLILAGVAMGIATLVSILSPRDLLLVDFHQTKGWMGWYMVFWLGLLTTILMAFGFKARKKSA